MGRLELWFARNSCRAFNAFSKSKLRIALATRPRDSRRTMFSRAACLCMRSRAVIYVQSCNPEQKSQPQTIHKSTNASIESERDCSAVRRSTSSPIFRSSVNACRSGPSTASGHVRCRINLSAPNGIASKSSLTTQSAYPARHKRAHVASASCSALRTTTPDERKKAQTSSSCSPVTRVTCGSSVAILSSICRSRECCCSGVSKSPGDVSWDIRSSLPLVRAMRGCWPHCNLSRPVHSQRLRIRQHPDRRTVRFFPTERRRLARFGSLVQSCL